MTRFDLPRWITVLLGFLSLVALAGGVEPSGQRELLAWRSLPGLPDTEGFAGSYAGVSGGALLVGGGANFPDRRPWEGGTKVWHDRVFILERDAAAWREVNRLPMPGGYGVSVSTKEGAVLIGGGDATRNFDACWIARWNGREVTFEPLPSLPVPLAMAAGAVHGRTVFIAGGLDRPDATTAQRIFLSLDLDAPDGGWRTLEPWPGLERFLAVGGVLDGSFFLMGGARLVPAANGGTQREWLRDAYRYTPGAGWKRIADVPRPTVAAPSPAPTVGLSHLLVLGGDDGSQLARTPQDHPGFSRELLAYHTITDTWARFGSLPFSLVTTPAVPWNDAWVVPGGEARPGIRSTAVWSASTQPRRAALGWANYTTLSLYLGAVVALGVWFGRRQKNTDDYFKAGGRLPWWAVGLSIYATMLSSITFMAIPAKAFATDWTFALANAPARADRHQVLSAVFPAPAGDLRLRVSRTPF